MEKFCDRSYLGRSKLEKLVMFDRISELPDELLIHILSLLPPKFAYTTSLLSKGGNHYANSSQFSVLMINS